MFFQTLLHAGSCTVRWENRTMYCVVSVFAVAVWWTSAQCVTFLWPAEGPHLPRESVKEPLVTFSGPQLHVYPIISPYLLSFIAKVLHHRFYLSLAQHASISMSMLKSFYIYYAQVKKNKQQLLNVWLFTFNLKSFSPFFLSTRLRFGKPLQFFPFKIVFLLLKNKPISASQWWWRCSEQRQHCHSQVSFTWLIRLKILCLSSQHWAAEIGSVCITTGWPPSTDYDKTCCWKETRSTSGGIKEAVHLEHWDSCNIIYYFSNITCCV